MTLPCAIPRRDRGDAPEREQGARLYGRSASYRAAAKPCAEPASFGGAAFDPLKHQLAKILVEEGERFEQGQGSYADIPAVIRREIVRRKAIGNIACFGALSETRATDLLPDRREEVTLLSDGEAIRATVAHPEDPGPFSCAPIAGLVSQRGSACGGSPLFEQRGGIVAACDTDGAHIVAHGEGR